MRPYAGVIDRMRSVALAARLKRLLGARGSFVPVLLLLALHPSANEAHGQSCRPAVLEYTVRDEKGKYLSEAELESVRKRMAQPAGGVSTVSFAGDGEVISEYSAEAKEAKTKSPALYYADAKSCELDVKEVTLRHAGKTMRLIFNLHIYRRAFVIDSIPFKQGTFELDQKGISEADSSRVIPAKRWKKISDNP